MVLPFPVKAGSFKDKYMCVSVTALTHMASLLVSSHEPFSLCAVHCRNTERSPHLCYKLAFLGVRRELYCIYGTISDSRERKSPSFSYVGEFTRKKWDGKWFFVQLCRDVCPSTGMGFTVVPGVGKVFQSLNLTQNFSPLTIKKNNRNFRLEWVGCIGITMNATDSSELVFCFFFFLVYELVSES